jgi:hypothetical protein
VTDRNSEFDADPDRRAVELLLGVLTGSTLLPFLQAISSKAGEDVYAKIRSRLSRKERSRLKIEMRAAGTVTIAANDTRVILQLPSSLTPDMAVQLDDVRVPATRENWLLVTWDAGRFRWLVHECDEPPPSVLTIRSTQDGSR